MVTREQLSALRGKVHTLTGKSRSARAYALQHPDVEKWSAIAESHMRKLATAEAELAMAEAVYASQPVSEQRFGGYGGNIKFAPLRTTPAGQLPPCDIDLTIPAFLRRAV